MKDLTIIIVSYNVKYYIEQCMNSIFRSEGIDLNGIEIYVVDNLSKDNTISYLKQRFPSKRFPNVHFIANKRNVGFGRANNQAIKMANSRYILFLNPDTLLTEHTLHDALNEAGKFNHSGAIGVKMLHTNGKFAPESRRGVPSPWTAFCKMSGLSKLFPHSKRFGRYYMQSFDKEISAPIDIVSGAFMLVPSQALQATGSFDEEFFMYGEDIDLSFRLLKQGFPNHYLPTPILHYKGESTHKNSFHYVHVFYEAMLIFFKKHYNHYSFTFALPIKVAIVMSAIISLLTQQCRMMHRFLFPRAFHRGQRMLYIGHSGTDIKRMADAYGLDIDCFEADADTLPQGHATITENATENYVQVIYDTKDFSTAQILRFFEYSNPKGNHIGTYWPEEGIMITGDKVYTVEE